MGRITGSWYVDRQLAIPCVFRTADHTYADNELDSSSEEDMSIEVISPPRRPVTRSVSAKRAADEMEHEDEENLFISSPRPRKVQRVAGTSGAFTG